MGNMIRRTEIATSKGQGTIAFFNDRLEEALSAWFAEFATQLGKHHYLRINLPRMRCFGGYGRYECVADLMLDKEKAAQPADKVLSRGVVQCVVEWPEEDEGSTQA